MRCWSGRRWSRAPACTRTLSTRAMPTTVRGRSLCSSGMKGARLGKAPMHPSSLGPGVAGQLATSKQDRHNVLEGSAARWGRTQPRDGDKPAGPFVLLTREIFASREQILLHLYAATGVSCRTVDRSAVRSAVIAFRPDGVR